MFGFVEGEYRNEEVYIVVFSTIMATLLMFAGTASADTGEVLSDLSSYPKCSDMPEAQIAGMKPGQGCRVHAVPSAKMGLSASGGVYRSGWTNQSTSESDSDLAEDIINVDAYKYIQWIAGGSWQLDDTCDDHNTNTSHAACFTLGGGGVAEKQDGYHYFQTSGYQNDNFSSSDTW